MKALVPLACICMATMTGCAQFDPLRGAIGSYRSYTEIKGSIQDGRYTSPSANFSCKVPALIKPGAVIQDGTNKKEGTGVVAFVDDFGLQLMVHWFEVPANANLASDSVLLEQAANFMKETDKKSLPEVTIGTEQLDVADRSTLFYMVVAEAPGVKVYIPPAQRKTVTKEMVMPHVLRGHLIFRRAGWVYALTTQTEAEFGADKANANEEQEAKVRSKLEKLLADFEFR